MEENVRHFLYIICLFFAILNDDIEILHLSICLGWYIFCEIFIISSITVTRPNFMLTAEIDSDVIIHACFSIIRSSAAKLCFRTTSLRSNFFVALLWFKIKCYATYSLLKKLVLRKIFGSRIQKRKPVNIHQQFVLVTK